MTIKETMDIIRFEEKSKENPFMVPSPKDYCFIIHHGFSAGLPDETLNDEDETIIIHTLTPEEAMSYSRLFHQIAERNGDRIEWIITEEYDGYLNLPEEVTNP